MTDPSPGAPQRSLTMQRIVLNRSRAFAIAGIVIGIVWVILSVALVFAGGNLVIHLLQLALGIGFLLIGILRLSHTRKELRRFEEQNGAGAGEQKPLR
ncbi:hypothetical protein [Leifsonia xyli]|uniref:hypothetical protein n=1 Tax=Leifsonia xyli TaxID=1575 RepID=UPI003D67DF8A